MGDVLFVWTAVSNMFGVGMRTTLAQRCVNPWFDLCLIKHVLTVWPFTSTSACLVTKQMFDEVCMVAKHFPFGQGFRHNVLRAYMVTCHPECP